MLFFGVISNQCISFNRNGWSVEDSRGETGVFSIIPILGFVDDYDREIIFALHNARNTTESLHTWCGHSHWLFKSTPKEYLRAQSASNHTHMRNGKNWRKITFWDRWTRKSNGTHHKKKVERALNEFSSLVMSYVANSDKQLSFVSFAVRYENSAIRKVTPIIWRSKITKRWVCIFHIFWIFHPNIRPNACDFRNLAKKSGLMSGNRFVLSREEQKN